MKHAAQKVRKMKTKVRKEAKKQRLAEKKKKKKQLEYIQQLQDKILAKNATLLKDTERSQIIRSKHKEVSLGDDIDHWPSKKAKEKQLTRYYRDISVKIGGANSCERCVYARQDCLVHNSR